MIQTYIEWMHPGSFFAESSHVKVAARVLPTEIPKRTTAYRFYDRQEIESDGEELSGKAKNFSPWTYFGAEFTIDQLQVLGGFDTLISNLQSGKNTRAVQTLYGNWYPLHSEDRVDAAMTKLLLAQAPKSGAAS